jgi:hypothetical protein
VRAGFLNDRPKLRHPPAARDAVKRALAQVGMFKSARDKASDDQKDRFFGRGKYARA